MSPFAQTFAQQQVPHRQLGTQKAWFKQHVSLLNLFSFILLIVLCFSYIVQVNRSVTKGYQMRELEAQISDLSLQNQQLEMTTQQAQSLTNVSRAVKMMGLVDAGQPTYIALENPSYALAQ